MDTTSTGETELDTRIRQQEVVAELGQRALETDDLDRLMHDASVAVADALGNEYCKVLELLPGGEEVFLRRGVGWREGEITAESLPRVEGDAGQLRQVFQNLLSNAIKYTGEGPPRVHVAAERNGSEWTVSVTDEGIGIDPADQERVFEVFQRLHDSTEFSGTGLGLALCERIVERHGGDIWVESDPDEGATFSFTLPAVGERSTD